MPTHPTSHGSHWLSADPCAERTRGGSAVKIEIREVENTRLTAFIPDYDS